MPTPVRLAPDVPPCYRIVVRIRRPPITTLDTTARRRARPRPTEAAAVSVHDKSAGRTESLAASVYARLRDEILTCALEPGRDLSEAELAARFSVSKTPVREALATLRTEGFVRAYPRRGYTIVPITFADMSELFAVRTILEAGAAELACARITDAELDELQALADVIYDHAEQPSLKRFIAANRDFHAAIARASGSARLHGLVLRQIDELERFFYLGARLRDVSRETVSDHHVIIDALRSRDREGVRRAVIDHNEVTRRGLFEAMAASQAPVPLTIKA